MSKPKYATKEEAKEAFKIHFQLTDNDLKTLWDWFRQYGMNSVYGNPTNRNPKNHIYLEEICQNYRVEWSSCKKGLSKELRTKIRQYYPQLRVDVKTFEYQ